MYQKEQLPDWILDWKWFLPIDEKVDIVLKKTNSLVAAALGL